MLIWVVQSCLQKYFAFHPTQIIGYFVPSRSAKRAYRDRHERGKRDVMDADVPLTNGTKADGQVVWS